MIDRELKLTDKGPLMRLLTVVLTSLDDLIVLIIAIAILGVASVLLYEAISDIVYYSSTQSMPHIVGELLLVLIIMELFRQVLRQLTRHIFTLNPFIFIGFIVSIRGMLLTEMRLAMNEVEWTVAIAMLGTHAAILLILVGCYYVYNNTGPVSWSGNSQPDDKNP